MTIVTKNSTYHVMIKNNYFIVTKIAETQPNPNGIDIGWSYAFKRLTVCIGEPAHFDHIMTTNVQEII